MKDISKWLNEVFERKEEPLSELIQYFSTPLRRFILTIVKNEEEAKELTQETFLKFLEKRHKFEDLRSLKSYLFQIAHNLTITNARKPSSRREENVEEMPEIVFEENISRVVIEDERKKFVYELLKILPEQQKKVVILRNWEELSFKEIAKILSLTEGAVKAHYFFALKKLKSEIVRREVQVGRSQNLY